MVTKCSPTVLLVNQGVCVEQRGNSVANRGVSRKHIHWSGQHYSPQHKGLNGDPRPLTGMDLEDSFLNNLLFQNERDFEYAHS